MKRRLINTTIVLLLIIFSGVTYALWCKATSWHIPCVFHKITGLYCPGCGITRMSLALLEGNFRVAFRSNAAVFILIPVGLMLLLKFIYHYIKFGNIQLSKVETSILWVIVVILITFGILRNIPIFYRLRP